MHTRLAPSEPRGWTRRGRTRGGDQILACWRRRSPGGIFTAASRTQPLVEGLAEWIEAHGANSAVCSLITAGISRPQSRSNSMKIGIAGAGWHRAVPERVIGFRAPMHADQDRLKRKHDHGEDDEGGGGARIRQASDNRGGADPDARVWRRPD